MEFRQFAELVRFRFSILSQFQLYRTNVSKDELWDAYLASFPPGSNPIYKERTEHDCQCCKQFIRAIGNVVAIIDGKLVSIWDIEIADVNYRFVADYMKALVESRPIVDAFLHYEKNVGVETSYQDLGEAKVKTWNHFNAEIPAQFVKSGDEIGTILSRFRSNHDVLLRALKEITVESCETVVELINQNSLYRGTENLFAVESFLSVKSNIQTLDDSELDQFCWRSVVICAESVINIRNTAIGTLLVDLSEGKPLDWSVNAFESKVAPANYKRPTALITKGMIEKAQKECEELGLTTALERRYAVTKDITVNNVLFANRSARKTMGAFEQLAQAAPENMKHLEKVEPINIETFLHDVLPTAETIELLLENSHASNLVSLIAPVHPDAKNMLKWPNNFTWNYAGDLTDSMKERVKAAGGDVTGDLRFSIQWNDEDQHNQSDYDAHCKMPNNFTIFYGDTRERNSGGNLDVDITCTRVGVPAVENITFPRRRNMPDGIYEFIVHNYSRRSGDSGFRAEIEFDGVTHSFNYPKGLTSKQSVLVAKVSSNNGNFRMLEHLPSSESVKSLYGLPTQSYHPVSMVMNSPNHWDEKQIGNKHYFFMLEGCKNEGTARGFFNEFLTDDLRDHRKVFEVLGSKMKVEHSDDQLSGVGFSSTQRNHVFCKVIGSFARTVKIVF